MFETEASINENDEHPFAGPTDIDILYSVVSEDPNLRILNLTDIDPSRKMIRVIGKETKTLILSW